VKDELHSGRLPEPEPEGLTVHKLAKEFLQHKHDRRQLGYLATRTYMDYEAVCVLMQKVFGKERLVADLRPDDFSRLARTMAKSWSAVRVCNVILRVRGVFRFAVKQGLLDRVPNFGPGFDLPPRSVMRLERAKKGPKLFTAEQIRNLLDVAGPQLKAMILLGINCGLGNADCGRLTLSALDLDNSFLNYPRPKTGIARRSALWPETVAAIREALASRPRPKREEDAGLVFVTRLGASWMSEAPGGAVVREFSKVARRVGIRQHRGLGFYALRHSFRTISDECLDNAAIDLVMGHCRNDMASVYRERISDQRLERVAELVRTWLFGPGDDDGRGQAPDVLHLLGREQSISKIG
jgi:integrase